LPSQTLKILRHVDISILESYYSQAFQSFPPTSSLKEKNELTARMLEVLEIQCSGDGELYARQLKGLFGAVDVSPPGETHILETIVEMVLVHIRDCEYRRFFLCLN
jgi:hypothetical protein